MISQADTNARQTPREARPSTNIAGNQIKRFIRPTPFRPGARAGAIETFIPGEQLFLFPPHQDTLDRFWLRLRRISVRGDVIGNNSASDRYLLSPFGIRAA